MIPNPIRKVLSSMRKRRVRALLMGGQACILYGGAEFSRDIDFAILADASNLEKLKNALKELRAENIAVPPFDRKYLTRGHALHFRCRHPEALGLRIDIMAKMRGVDPFASLWKRRTTFAFPDSTICHLMSLPDLVQAKKTQRDKDWPMLRRLLEADYFAPRDKIRVPMIRFWFLELRTPELLIQLAEEHPALCSLLKPRRKLLSHAMTGDFLKLEKALRDEEDSLRAKDRVYWAPLRKELEAMRHERRGKGKHSVIS